MSVMAKSARPVTVAFDANWKNILECAAAEVFEMMADVHLQQYSAPLEEPKGELTAMVGLAGALCGMTTLRCSETTSVRLASLMLGGGQRSKPGLQMTVTDHASRYLLLCEALESTCASLAFTAFELLFQERGLPHSIRSDNGVPFASPNSLFNLSKLSVWWLRLGHHHRTHPTRSSATERSA
jgi:hypothetical protein